MMQKTQEVVSIEVKPLVEGIIGETYAKIVTDEIFAHINDPQVSSRMMKKFRKIVEAK